MFSTLTKSFEKIFTTLKGKGKISERDITEVIRQIRITLLEADVALVVVKDFITKLKEKIIQSKIDQSINPVQKIIDILHDDLIEVLGKEAASLNLVSDKLNVIMMCGLQGSGKTTTSAKLAKLLTIQKKKVLIASLDIYRPAAQKQLQLLCQENNLDMLPIIEKETPLEITQRALEFAEKEDYDVLILDTAGRLYIDTTLMQELQKVKKIALPQEIILVVDAMIGQDAVNLTKSFNEQLSITAVILTRIDSDTCGGSAISIRYVTNCAIKFLCTGEKIDDIEIFYANRIVKRILSMGDIESLIERAKKVSNEDKIDKVIKKVKKGQFDLEDMCEQYKVCIKLGGLGSVIKMLPGMNNFMQKNISNITNNQLIIKNLAIIYSMTKQEKQFPKILNASRKRRIAKGAGVTVSDVNIMLKQFQQTKAMVSKVGKMDEQQLQNMTNVFNK